MILPLGPQNLNFLFFGFLQKRFADLSFKGYSDPVLRIDYRRRVETDLLGGYYMNPCETLSDSNLGQSDSSGDDEKWVDSEG